MKKILTKKSIFMSSFALTLFVVFIKFLGLVKHIVMSKMIGANFETDAFYIATGVIGHLSILLFSSLSITLLSLYAERKEKKGVESATGLIKSSYRLFIPIALIVTLIFYSFSPIIAHLLVPSYEGEQLAILVKYIKIMSLSFIPCCYSLIGNVVLEERKTFIPGRLKDFFQHLFVILGAIFFYKTFGVVSLVYLFFFASVAQAVIIFIKTRKQYKINIRNVFLDNKQSS